MCYTSSTSRGTFVFLVLLRLVQIFVLSILGVVTVVVVCIGFSFVLSVLLILVPGLHSGGVHPLQSTMTRVTTCGD